MPDFNVYSLLIHKNMLKFSRDIRENFALIMQIINRPQCSKYFSKDEFVRKIFFIDKILQSFSAFKFGDRRSDRYAPRFTILTLTNKRIYFFSDGKIKFNDLHSLMLRYHMILFFDRSFFLRRRFSL